MFSITRLNTLKKRGCYTKTFTKCFYSKSNTCSAYIMMNLVKLKFFPIGFTIKNNVIVFLIKDLGIIIKL